MLFTPVQILSQKSSVHVEDNFKIRNKCAKFKLLPIPYMPFYSIPLNFIYYN